MPDLKPAEARIAILVPCLNEEDGVASVVAEYRQAFPQARLLVVDNGSSDRTAERARAAGAEVVREPRPGKARAIVTAFALLEEDLVIMVDGDGSYPATGALRLVEAWRADPADMITGIRVAGDERAFRRFHQFGSSVFAAVFRLVFHYSPGDLFSGLRLFTRRFYKNVPLLFRGFELETELTVQAVDKDFRLAEVEVPFGARATGSSSKLRTVGDGLRILRLMVVLFRDYRPLAFFGAFALAFFSAGLLAGSMPIYEYYQTRMVGRFPLAILAAALMNLSLFTLLTGVMLQSSLRHRRESYQVALRRLGNG
jgi:glycosyltransferase involved in cell wall biosynthesis